MICSDTLHRFRFTATFVEQVLRWVPEDKPSERHQLLSAYVYVMTEGFWPSDYAGPIPTMGLPIRPLLREGEAERFTQGAHDWA